MIQRVCLVFKTKRSLLNRKNFQRNGISVILCLFFSHFSLANSFLYFVPGSAVETNLPTLDQQARANSLVGDIFQGVPLKDRSAVIYTLVQFVGDDSLDRDSSSDKDRAQDQRTQAIKVALRNQLGPALKSRTAEKLLPALNLLAYDYITYQKIRKSSLNKIKESFKSFSLSESSKSPSDYFEQVSYRLHLAIRQSVVENRLDTLLSEVRSPDPIIQEHLFNIIENERMTTEMRMSATQALGQSGPISRQLYSRIFNFIKTHIEGHNKDYLDINVNILTNLVRVINKGQGSSRKKQSRLAELMNRPHVLSALRFSRRNNTCRQAFDMR